MGAQESSPSRLTCPQCYCFYRDPVSLACAHSLCQECLPACGLEDGLNVCPVCRDRSSETPKTDAHLCLSVEAYLQKCDIQLHPPGDSLCPEHQEERKLYCRQDNETICMVCLTSKRHRDHTPCPATERAQELKEELQTAVGALKGTLKTLGQARDVDKKLADHIKSQTQHTERQVKAEFEKLHQFLRDEEEARLAALREEEEQKSQVMKEKIEKCTEEMISLALTIRTVQQEMQTSDISFIENFCNTKSRAQCTLQDPELLSGALIDVAKHLGNLKFNVWEKMLGTVQYSPITFDPNTAGTSLVLTDDLTAVTMSRIPQDVPSNLERFDLCAGVLGSQGLSSGTHCWEVQVGEKAFWAVGVAKESTNRKGRFTVHQSGGYWAIHRKNREYSACDSSWTPLKLNRKPHRIRVELDYDRGKVSFFNPSDMSLIYTFKDTFTGRIFPFLSPLLNEKEGLSDPLTICSLNVVIVKEMSTENKV